MHFLRRKLWKDQCKRWVIPRVLSLESFEYFGASKHFSLQKKRVIFMSKTLMGWVGWGANQSGVVNFHCMQMSLLMSIHYIVCSFFSQIEALDLHTQSIQKQIIEYHINSKFYTSKRTRLSIKQDVKNFWRGILFHVKLITSSFLF